MYSDYCTEATDTVKRQLYTSIMDDTPEPPLRRRGPAPTKHLDLLWAAARLFSERGVAQTSTRDVAAAANTTERTLFKHFGSKDGLVQAVIAQAVVPHLAPSSLEALRKAIEAHGDDLRTWHTALLQSRDKAIGEAPELARLLLVELLRDDALRARFSQAWLDAVWQPLHGLFERLQSERRLRRDIPAAALARMFLSLNLGYLVGRHVLAPNAGWNAKSEILAITSLFASGAQPP
ncbi:MAG TPA: helix-turn-helix domain-containing protein [Rubrivivax sp.]|nr:helix-turn-helix domain-containing protein [Rubrivivax sp.]